MTKVKIIPSYARFQVACEYHLVLTMSHALFLFIYFTQARNLQICLDLNLPLQ